MRCPIGACRPLRAFVLLVWLLAASRASAHALGAECKLKDGCVQVEAYFDDDTPARKAKVVVQDRDRKSIAQGRTDDKGRWSFPAPPPGRYRVTVDADDAHRARVTFTIPAPGQPGSNATSPTNENNSASPGREQDREAVQVSEGPGREEFTRFPWRNTMLGLAILGAVGLGSWLVLRSRHPAATPKTEKTSPNATTGVDPQLQQHRSDHLAGPGDASGE